ncbi:MAG: aldolase catalytic domain-containing protein [Clostridiales bacterium]|nr:aldolase catalytic domain-containing protein [Clostridiales bacterium]
METKGNLMSFRPDIKVVDATLRDGGLVNNFYFEDEFVKELYQANIKAGVDYMEFGYKASKELFDPAQYGKWKFCDEQSIRDIVGNNESDMKIAVMADVGRTEMSDIPDRSESVVDLIRVATYIHQIPAAIEMIEECHAKGYETSVNIMAVATVRTEDLDQALDMLGQTNVDIIYLVDSYGSLYPEQIRALSKKYLAVGEKYGKAIGVHAHNNQQLAFANTIEATAAGVSYLDATMMGMGRGAGNCALEALLSFLKNPKYRLIYALKFVQDYMVPLKDNGLVWGYDIPYMITGFLNRHPRTAIAAIQENNRNYVEFYKEAWDREN